MATTNEATFRRVLTTITHDFVSSLPNEERAVWKAAHACLNAEPSGALGTSDLEAAIRLRYPEHDFCRTTLQQNLSKSPDFQQHWEPSSRSKLWHLTGSETGVPKSLSKNARESLKRAQDQVALANAASTLIDSLPTPSQEPLLTPPPIPMHSRPSSSVRGTTREAPPIPRYSSRPDNRRPGPYTRNHVRSVSPITEAKQLSPSPVDFVNGLQISPLVSQSQPPHSHSEPQNRDHTSEGRCPRDFTLRPTCPAGNSCGLIKTVHCPSNGPQLQSSDVAFKYPSNASGLMEEDAPPEENSFRQWSAGSSMVIYLTDLEEIWARRRKPRLQVSSLPCSVLPFPLYAAPSQSIIVDTAVKGCDYLKPLCGRHDGKRFK